MLLHESRRAARATPEGEVILLEDQDRSLWDRERIGEGQALVRRVLAGREIGFYAIQAAIAAEHASAPSIGRDELGADRRALRSADACRPVAGGRAEPRRGDRRARRTGGGTGADRRHPRARRARRLSPGAFGARRALPAAWPDRTKPSPPTTGRCRSPGRSRPGTSWKSAGASWCRRAGRWASVAGLAPNSRSAAPRSSRDSTAMRGGTGGWNAACPNATMAIGSMWSGIRIFAAKLR